MESTESSSSSGSSTSGSSSSDSSSDSESSSTTKNQTQTRRGTKTTTTENEHPPATTTTTTTAAPKPKTTAPMSAASKMRAVAAGNSQRNGGTTLSSDDDDDEDDDDVDRNLGARKITTIAAAVAAKRKPSVSGATKANTNINKTNAPKSSNNSMPTKIKENGERKHSAAAATAAESSSSPDATDDSLKESTRNARKIPPKMATTTTAARSKQLRNKLPPKKPTAATTSKTATTAATTAAAAASKSSESSDDSESGSGSDTGSSTASDSEESEESSNSYSSQIGKNTKGKRASNAGVKRSDTDDNDAREQSHPIRKLTRSLSMRRTKQQVKQDSGGDSDTDAELDGDKQMLTKCPAKKPAAGLNSSAASKCKVKKEFPGGGGLIPIKARPSSPQVQLEKKCPIEGCDSSGHLSGNLDRHFLPEACPIYHNMSASECKERANERKLRNEQRQKLPANVATATNNAASQAANRTLTTEQKEFLAKIRESRARFRPASNIINDKIKLEKDCTDEDREPNLSGLVPDYDLQLFREAQALASEKIEDELKDLPVGKGIKYITMGKYKMKVWYQSPYPDDAARLPKMYICEFCLRYQKSETGIKRHAQKCVWRHPPGDEIYRKGKLQVWQVDGKRYKQYCQHLCLLAKFFLDHKTLYYDVEPFLFYIMTLADVDGCHIVGYFSKEKNSFYNVSCILTLPPYQRKGYGRLLIDFSYLLTRVEGKIGSPEKPLSDLGLISYRSYWKDVLLDYLCNRSGNTLSIKDVSQEMAIYSYDIVSTLQALGMMKYWKGKHIVLKKQDVLDEYEERVKRRGTFPKIDDSCLRWQPVQLNTSP